MKLVECLEVTITVSPCCVPKDDPHQVGGVVVSGDPQYRWHQADVGQPILQKTLHLFTLHGGIDGLEQQLADWIELAWLQKSWGDTFKAHRSRPESPSG